MGWITIKLLCCSSIIQYSAESGYVHFCDGARRVARICSSWTRLTHEAHHYLCAELADCTGFDVMASGL